MFKNIINKAFFCYNAKVSALAGGSSSVQQITFSNHSDFLLKEIRNTLQAAGAILITIALTSGDQFSNQALDSALFSTGFNGIKFFENVIIPANTNINVTIQNTTGGALSHEIQFWGYKIDKQS